MLMKNPRRTPRTGIIGRTISRLVALVVVVAVVIVGAVAGFRWLGNPFTTEVEDRSAPPVLLELRDLADFHAAQGRFEVTVDVEHDVQWVPSVIAGDRVQFIAVGAVDAVVDFRLLGTDAVRVDDATSTAVITLSSPTLAAPVLDLDHSHVMNRDRGVLDRLGGVFSDSPTGEAELMRMAEDKIAAAAAETDLLDRAEHNTRATLTAMLTSMGIEHVEVRFPFRATAPVAGGVAP